jgi:NAD+ synthase (glutamine-hydrolysing)
VGENALRIEELYKRAAKAEACLAVFPELSLTGYTIGDLVHSSRLLECAEEELARLAEATKGQNCAMIVGLPFRCRDGLYNAAAFLADGEVKGMSPKANLPTYNEFYENRWFSVWRGKIVEASAQGRSFPFGPELLFDLGGVLVGIEICEDLWVAQPPSGALAAMGAKIVCNPSASPEQIGKEAYRRDLAKIQSGRLMCAYIYAGCDSSESTSEVVMGGHHIIAENYALRAEIPPFGQSDMCTADIDFSHLEYERRLTHFTHVEGGAVVKTSIKPAQKDLWLHVDPNPFAPEEGRKEREERLDRALRIQATGLAERMRSTSQRRITLGLSGGLDSALAALVACEAADLLGWARKESLLMVTMPGLASSTQTQSNSVLLARALGCESLVVPISDISRAELAAIGHNGATQDVTYENVQARSRTSVLFNLANLRGGIVLGTGDLSEIAMGWNTYNGDQQSHYNVNASIPKTLVRLLVGRAADMEKYGPAREVLLDILDTPISPELTASGDGITQATEEIIGPYELHDFFLYYTIRYGDAPEKIAFLAERAFKGRYSGEEIEMWLRLFTRRFNQSQFKRDNMPNGPKVGSVSLSPRGDWRMPSDMP